MKTRTVKFCLSIGLVGCRRQETRTFEFDDDATEEAMEAEIDEALMEWRDEKVELWCEEVE